MVRVGNAKWRNLAFARWSKLFGHFLGDPRSFIAPQTLSKKKAFASAIYGYCPDVLIAGRTTSESFAGDSASSTGSQSFDALVMFSKDSSRTAML